MIKKCLYCKVDLTENSVVDVCPRCGYAVWGDMFKVIVASMENAKETGNLNQGSISESWDKPIPKTQGKSF